MAKRQLTAEERRAEKRRARGHYEDDPEFQAAHGGTYVQRTSSRWTAVRNKGLPFSRHVLKALVPALPGQPGTLVLSHPTRGGKPKFMKVTPALAAVFYPGIAGNPFLSSMVFGN